MRVFQASKDMRSKLPPVRVGWWAETDGGTVAEWHSIAMAYSMPLPSLLCRWCQETQSSPCLSPKRAQLEGPISNKATGQREPMLSQTCQSHPHPGRPRGLWRTTLTRSTWQGGPGASLTSLERSRGRGSCLRTWVPAMPLCNSVSSGKLFNIFMPQSACL
jgi:hypothetical protein